MFYIFNLLIQFELIKFEHRFKGWKLWKQAFLSVSSTEENMDISKKKKRSIYIKENGYTFQNVSLWVFYTVLYTDFAIGIWIFYEFLWPKEHPRDFFFFFNAR